MKFIVPVALLLLPALSPGLRAATLDDEINAFLNIVAVSGRERPAADFIAGRLAGLPATRDALGDVVLTVGSGEPRRLAACALGEPGLIVSGIREDGYLRVVPDGARPARGALDAVVRGADGRDRRRPGVAGRRGGPPVGPSPAGGASASRAAVLGGGSLHRRRRRERGRGRSDGDPADRSGGPDPPPLEAGRRAGGRSRRRPEGSVRRPRRRGPAVLRTGDAARSSSPGRSPTA